MTFNKDALLAKRHDTGSGFPEEDVEVPGFGTIRVRGLSRHEVLHIQTATTVKKKGPLVVEQMTVSLGCIDPTFTEDEVSRWQKVSVGGELDKVTNAIGRLSGMFGDPATKAYEDFEADPGSEFRVLPSSEAGDDSSSTPNRDE